MNILNRELLAKKIEERVSLDIAEARVGSASICVLQRGEEIYRGVHGVGIDKNSMFRIASMTKPITSVAVLIQNEKGLIDLDAPISEILPEFSDMTIGVCDKYRFPHPDRKAINAITARTLLTHTSGVGCGEMAYPQIKWASKKDRGTLDDMVAFWSRSYIEFEPGTAVSYSPMAGFDLLAKMVELTSGERYDVFLRKNILAPCGMIDTTFEPSESQWGRIIPMHDIAYALDTGKPISVRGKTHKGCIFDDCPTTHFCGGAGLTSTLDDYIGFAEMLRRGGVSRSGDRIVSEKSILDMRTPWVSEDIMPGHQRWGLGVRVIVADDYHMPKSCFGWSGAYGTHFWIDPENEITAIYMKNCLVDGGDKALTAFNFENDVYASLE